MEDKKTNKGGLKFALGLGVGIILGKIIFDVLVPMFFG